MGMVSETGWSLQHGSTERGLDFLNAAYVCVFDYF